MCSPIVNHKQNQQRLQTKSSVLVFLLFIYFYFFNLLVNLPSWTEPAFERASAFKARRPARKVHSWDIWITLPQQFHLTLIWLKMVPFNIKNNKFKSLELASITPIWFSNVTKTELQLAQSCRFLKPFHRCHKNRSSSLKPMWNRCLLQCTHCT